MRARSRNSLPLIGAAALLGALGALALAPRARTTMAAEVALAVGHRPGWLQAAWTGPEERRAPAVERAVSAAPADVELQIAAATLPSGHVEETLKALDPLARRFPRNASIRAHQLRHLTRGDRTREAIAIRRAEFADFNRPGQTSASPVKTVYPAPAVLQQFLTAAAAGGRLEPDNGFFPAMQAVGEFAAGQDQAALRHMQSAAAKPIWDDHAVEETRAQARLLRRLYGDRGAVQRALNAMALLLPHFAPLRHAARMAVWHAAQRERAGETRAAQAIRGSVMRLGVPMAEQSPLLIGKSVGLAIFEIGMEPIAPEPLRQTYSPREVVRRRARDRYVANLETHGATAEAGWVRSQGARMDALDQRVRETLIVINAHEETLFPPLRLLGWWALGVVLLKQIAALAVLGTAAVLLGRLRPPSGATGSRLTGLGASLALLLAPVVLIGAIGGLSQVWDSLDAGITIRLLAATVSLWGAARWWGRSASRDPAMQPSFGLWLAIAVLVTLSPFLLVGMMGSVPLVSTSLMIGLGLLAVLGLARWSGRRAKAEVRPRWQPALVALLSVLPTTIGVFRARDLLAWDTLFRQHVLGLASPYQENFGGVGSILPLLVLLPLALLAFFVLCRVAALDLPVRAGLARGLRQTIPLAVGLLTAAYLGTLVPTVAEDHRADRKIQQTLQDELGALEEAGPGERPLGS